MNIEELKRQLAEGKITLEQFKAELKKLLEAKGITQEQHDETLKGADNAGDGSGGTLTQEQVQKMIEEATAKAAQSASDQVRTEYSKKNKELQDKLDELTKSKMSEEEKAKFEREKLERELREREQALKLREVALHTVDKLRELELPLEFREILAGQDIEATNQRIETFRQQWQKALNAAVEERFKQNGGDPGKGQQQTGEKNPWSKEHWNRTEQGKIYAVDRAKAIKLAAEAGQALT
ncbi:uncharacterized protein DUF4355 [Brevibacillus sp. AG162]|uniref:DUF4355 domain-containing protein n=1 Tax=Brevibacillus sp. AG162 TaxID=2572910 RepID=UPI00115406CD|nr:DUF4355 domain-containing protein [Brevibacillus sp. AG162]TQK41960.1 uncharacterized protein DUF4355 [Brevibacillus sp. AG162]